MSDTQTGNTQTPPAPLPQEVVEEVSVIDRVIALTNSLTLSGQTIRNMSSSAKDISKDSDFVQDWLVPIIESQNKAIEELSAIVLSSHVQTTNMIDDIGEQGTNADEVIIAISQYIQQIAVELSVVPMDEINGTGTTVTMPKENFINSIRLLQSIGQILVSSGYSELLEQRPEPEATTQEEKKE